SKESNNLAEILMKRTSVPSHAGSGSVPSDEGIAQVLPKTVYSKEYRKESKR
ncbi:Hevamine-A, partial [Clarias magur]